MPDDTNYEKIPQPPEHAFGLLGNLPDIDPSFPHREIWRLQAQYGPIMKLNLGGPRIFVGNQRLVNEISDPKRFQKSLPKPIIEVRALTGDGLFTASNEEANWGKAHRMLISAFGPFGIRKMFGGMVDITSQMILKWDRLGPDHEIVCSDDLTRLAFDTIGLCAFSFRFNEFYSEDVHPFARQMSEVLLESGKRANRPSWTQALYHSAEQKRQDNVAEMHQLCDQIVADRKAHPQPDNHDLLNTMLNAVDKETGERLSDENIRYQLATFLVAGHETTSATLSFTYYNLLKNPEKFLKAQQQVDEVLGDRVMTVDDIPKLDYLDACVKETLRLSSPIPAYTVASGEDQVIGGKYFVPHGTEISVNIRSLHHDTEVWGDDIATYRPERFLDGGFAHLPPNAWKPFGNGPRACIGRGFAEQEMAINLAMVLQRFQLELANPSYELQLKSTLTIKPWNFKMKVRRRPGKSINVGIPGGVQQPSAHKESHALHEPVGDGKTAKPLSVFFGGNTGTCEAMAQSLETTAGDYGYQASVSSLDAATEHIPSDRPVVFITSSYEGYPPDNAKKFVSWLESLNKSKSLEGIHYAVFGVGNSDWSATFHKVPKLVDELLAKNGASRTVDAGFSNVKEDLVGPWEDWVPKLFTSISGGDIDGPPQASKIEVKIERNPLARALGGSDIRYGTVMANRELAGTEVGLAKRHLEVKLPEETEYIAGDYLVVQPVNPRETVHRAMTFFDLEEYDEFTVTGTSKKILSESLKVAGEFFRSAVELASPATKRQLETIATFADSEAKTKIAKFLDDYQGTLSKRYSVLDVLDETSIQLPFAQFLDMLPPLAPRMYSIASSPMHDAGTVALAIDVLEAPALSGHGMFQGVASNYLATRKIGDRINCFVRPTNVGFRLPPPEVPLIMMAAGTGIAPMRAFLQERAAIAKAGGRKLGPAILYFGCRHETRDYIYKDELQEWEKMGIVQVKTAFSKMGDRSRYVPDVIWEDRAGEVANLFQNGGKIFLCGSAAKLGKSCANVCKKIYSEKTGKSEEEAESWLQSVRAERFIADVY
ncbi:cytochrome P450 [Lecanosticta acicola]|uniref:Bifunctional cytochrome P450/NADPH--P450 reductase n=1 Tax=Lecanosticta acicola TaxID=111012 RepID=A0AAI8YVY2_9PEZI|nr:cytochrome P450 [Lecanosticta acicola]